MTPRQEFAASRAQGKRLIEPSRPKAWFDTALFSFVEDYQWYEQQFTKKRVVLGRNINFPQL